MHVLQLIPKMTVGGVERGVLDVSRGLIQRGHQVSIVSSGGPLVERLKQLGATHYTLPVHEKSPITMLRCLPQVETIIRDSKIDIVHARSRVPGWIGYIAARRTQRKFVTTAHGFYRASFGSRVMSWGRPVIVPSQSLSRYMSEQFKVTVDRLRVIPRGVDLSEFSFQPQVESRRVPVRIGLVGRLTRIKGHEVALRAVAHLLEKGKQVKLCIAGDTPDSPRRSQLEALIQSLGLHEAVQWFGVRSDIPAFIASMDLMIVPSVYPESFGRGVIEAQAIGRPVVASRLGALEELIEDEQTGLLVNPKDPAALANGITRFMEDSALAKRCVSTALERVKKMWSVDQMVEKTLKIYEECLNRPRIVIWKLSALGDVVLSTPSLRALRE